MASTTERPTSVVRYNRRSRLLHTACYLTSGVLLATGWWIRAGHEGDPSILARLADQPDVEVHRKAGWLLVVVCGIAITLGLRGAITFVRETLRINRGDGRWFVRWPLGTITGRFARHRGHFDPGQRLANLAFVASLATLIGTGVGLTTVHGGSSFVWLVRAHRYATYAFTVLVIGHVLLAIGILPGYRGVWRSMHLGGRTPRATAQRLWPEASPRIDDAPARTKEELTC